MEEKRVAERCWIDSQIEAPMEQTEICESPGYKCSASPLACVTRTRYDDRERVRERQDHQITGMDTSIAPAPSSRAPRLRGLQGQLLSSGFSRLRPLHRERPA